MPPPSTMGKNHPGFREELGYIPPPNRKLPPVPGSQYNTCDRIKRGKFKSYFFSGNHLFFNYEY